MSKTQTLIGTQLHSKNRTIRVFKDVVVCTVSQDFYFAHTIVCSVDEVLLFTALGRAACRVNLNRIGNSVVFLRPQI